MEFRPHSGVIGCAFVLSFAAALSAQDAQFTAQSRLVLVPVNVADDKGRPVEGLQASDFLTLDNGRRRQAIVDTIGTGIAPIALVVAVQSSGISLAALEKVRGIGGMIQPLITGERGRAGLVSFSEKVVWHQELTGDPDLIARAFYQIQPGEYQEGRMFDAISSAVERLRLQPNSRRVLLLIAESRDRGSETDLETVAAQLLSAGVTVYVASYSAFWTSFTSRVPVGLPPRRPRPDHPNDAMNTMNGAPPNPFNPRITPHEHRADILTALRELGRLNLESDARTLTQATGGRMFSFARQKGLDEAIRKLGEELHSQYLLSFAPEGAGPGFHTLEVRVKGKGKLQVRARPGYWVD